MNTGYINYDPSVPIADNSMCQQPVVVANLNGVPTSFYACRYLTSTNSLDTWYSLDPLYHYDHYIDLNANLIIGPQTLDSLTSYYVDIDSLYSAISGSFEIDHYSFNVVGDTFINGSFDFIGVHNFDTVSLSSGSFTNVPVNPDY